MSAVIAGLLAGCANAPWQPPAYEAAIKTYYEAHASEENGQCLAPYIVAFAEVQVIEDSQERMVVEARYLYRDAVRSRRDSMEGERLVRDCVGFNQRSFVLAQSTTACR